MYFKNRLCHFFTIRDITKHFQYKNVKESNRNIKMYSASVSHEMLNPIKCIINFSKQMLDSSTGSESRDFLNMIFCSAKLLQCHTQDLLDLNLLHKGVFKLQNQQIGNLHTSVMEIVKLMRAQAQLRFIKLKTKFNNFPKRELFYFD